MILGHTIFDEMKYLYDKKVIVIDLEHQINTENGKCMVSILKTENSMLSILTEQKQS